jgi:hypothetical protein
VAKFHMMYTAPRTGLDPVIEADLYRVSGKFFEFLVNKEVVRTLKVDAVLQIRRMDDDEQEGDLARKAGNNQLDDLLASMPDPSKELDQMLASMPDPSKELDQMLASMPDPSRRTVRDAS